VDHPQKGKFFKNIEILTLKVLQEREGEASENSTSTAVQGSVTITISVGMVNS
jgi:hypothetical protein